MRKHNLISGLWIIGIDVCVTCIKMLAKASGVSQGGFSDASVVSPSNAHMNRSSSKALQSFLSASQCDFDIIP